MSTAIYYGNTSWTQCELVNSQFGLTNCCIDGSSPQCDRPWNVQSALKAVGCYGGFIRGPLTLGDVQSELEGGWPIGAGIVWGPIGPGHLVMVVGVDSVAANLVVSDPASAQTILPFNEFCQAYRSIGRWEGTFLTRPGPRAGKAALGSPGITHSTAAAEKNGMDLVLDLYTTSLEDAAAGDPLVTARVSGKEVIKNGPISADDLHNATSSTSSIDSQSFDILSSADPTCSEVRLLQIPALNVRAAWIRGHGPVGDRVMPLAPVPRFLVAGRAYGPAEFANAIQTAARRRLSFLPEGQQESATRLSD